MSDHARALVAVLGAASDIDDYAKAHADLLEYVEDLERALMAASAQNNRVLIPHGTVVRGSGSLLWERDLGDGESEWVSYGELRIEFPVSEEGNEKVGT